jgi:hypothetical protein
MPSLTFKFANGSTGRGAVLLPPGQSTKHPSLLSCRYFLTPLNTRDSINCFKRALSLSLSRSLLHSRCRRQTQLKTFSTIALIPRNDLHWSQAHSNRSRDLRSSQDGQTLLSRTKPGTPYTAQAPDGVSLTTHFSGHYLSLATTFLWPLLFSGHYLSLAPTF